MGPDASRALKGRSSLADDVLKRPDLGRFSEVVERRVGRRHRLESRQGDDALARAVEVDNKAVDHRPSCIPWLLELADARFGDSGLAQRFGSAQKAA